MTSKRMIEQRKRIIKDVVKQLDVKKLIASTGAYLLSYDDAHNQQFNGSDQAYKTPKECRVCAIGSLFITSVDRYNKLAADDVRYNGTAYSGVVAGNSMVDHLSKWWASYELRIIEAAFEGNIVLDPNGNDLFSGFDEDYFYYDEMDKRQPADPAYIKAANKALKWRDTVRDKALHGGSDIDDFILRAICKKLLRNPECVFRAR